MNSQSLFLSYDLESGGISTRKPSRRSRSPTMLFFNRIRYFFKLHPLALFLTSLLLALFILLFLSTLTTKSTKSIIDDDEGSSPYPFPQLKNLVMVAGHSIYTSSSCEKSDREDSWFLEPYQKHPGQASTFLAHIREGVLAAGRDDSALLLFSGGETRKDAGPRSEAQSYWSVADSNSWFGKEEMVKSRALTEEHARDSFENLLFSVCRFRELTGNYPQNITVVSYDFKEQRFAHLHRMALGFPEERFLYIGTPASPSAKESAGKGEASVRSQFEEDPYGCLGSLHRKRLKRDPFHRSIPYPNGCPELKGLFSYCGSVPYTGMLPWSQ